MRPLQTVTIPEILKLLKKYLQLSISRATLYTLIKAKSFPHNTGIGKPRRWRKDEVMAWIRKEHKRKTS